jgi:chemotaxis protein MotB
MKTYMNRISLLGMVVFFIIGFGAPVSGMPITLAPEKVRALVQEYENRITLTSNEIATLTENLVWLEMKIEKMGALRKPIPSHLYTSVYYKKDRIQVLELSRERLLQRLSDAKALLPEEKMTTLEKTEDRNSLVHITELLKTAGLADWFEAVEDSTVTAAKTRLPVLFASGSAFVAEDYQPFLEKVAAFIKAQGTWAIVDGYTDKNPIKTKQYPSNFELGAGRAANIVHALVGYGADPSLFKVSSTGEHRFPDARPVSKNKKMERYVHITLIFDQKIEPIQVSGLSDL